MQVLIDYMEKSFSDISELSKPSFHQIFSESLDSWETMYNALKYPNSTTDLYQSVAMYITYSNMMFEAKLHRITLI